MIVNPFSYLMNKISQKVSKSGDRMTGELEFYNLGDSIHINRAGNATYSGWIKFSNANGLCGMYGAHNDKKPYFYDGNNFTQIALTSDLANIPITLHKQIVTNESVSFEIPNNGLATIVVGHPYTGTWGEYAVIGGYTTGSNAITTFHASTAVSSIVKTSNNIIKLTCNSGIFVYCTGVGVSLV